MLKLKYYKDDKADGSDDEYTKVLGSGADAILEHKCLGGVLPSRDEHIKMLSSFGTVQIVLNLKS